MANINFTFLAMIFGASLCPSASPNMRGPSVSNFSSNSRTPRMSAKNAWPLVRMVLPHNF